MHLKHEERAQNKANKIMKKHDDKYQSYSWHKNGKNMALVCKKAKQQLPTIFYLIGVKYVGHWLYPHHMFLPRSKPW